MYSSLPFNRPSPHIQASICYILEMNVNMLDAIWLEGEIDFAGVSREDFMFQLETYFNAVKRKGETHLGMKTGKCLGCFKDGCSPVHMFYSGKAKSFFNLVFLEREGCIYDITVCHLTNEVMPKHYIDRSFEFMEDQKTDFVPNDDYIQNTKLINQVIKDYESIQLWTPERIQILSQKLGHLFDTLEDEEFSSPSIQCIKFKNLIHLVGGINYRLSARDETEEILKQWKSLTPADNKMKQLDIMLENAPILTSMANDELYMDNQLVSYQDVTYACRVQMEVSEDLALFRELNALVMPHYIKFKESLDRFFERNKLFEGDKNEEIFYDYKAMYAYRLWFLETKRKYRSMFNMTLGRGK